MDLNEEKESIKKNIDEMNKKILKIEDNVNILTHIFEEILKEFEKIKKEVKK